MTAAPASPRIALGPLTYYWPRGRTLDFYSRALSWPVDIVYLGETVCSRRHELRLADWIDLAGRFADAGKEAVLSTYELIENDADLRIMRQVVENGRFRVEANDMGAVRLLSGRVPFVSGPFLNVYNASTLELLAECGAMRWVAPVELSGAGLRDVLSATTANIETELFAFGRLPLAVSARCFTARYHNLSKDHCEYRCIEDPEGLALTTQDGEPFLVLNGVQTQSARVQNLLPFLPEALAMGVNVLRLSPQPERMEEAVEAFAAAVRGDLDAVEASRRLASAMPAAPCDGYWHGRAGMEHVGSGT
ncbi:MAG TPA: U32 family peptidase [Usitatibacter sp.]|nr:U32 family peptidase [Usitatibacter sp.]